MFVCVYLQPRFFNCWRASVHFIFLPFLLLNVIVRLSHIRSEVKYLCILYLLALLLMPSQKSAVKVIVGDFPSSWMSVQEGSMIDLQLPIIRWTKCVVRESLDDSHRLPIQRTVSRRRRRIGDELGKFNFVAVYVQGW